MLKKVSLNKLILLVIIFLLSLSSNSFAVNAKNGSEEIHEKQKQLEEIQKELEWHKGRLRITKKKEQEVLGKLVVINHTLKKTKKELEQTKGQLVVNQRKLNRLEIAVDEGKKKLMSRKDFLTSRILEVYKSGGLNNLDLLLASDTLSDFINRSYFFEKILGRDVKLLEEIRGEYEGLKKNKEQLEGYTQEIKDMARVIENKKNIFEDAAKEKAQIYQQLESRRIEYEKKVSKLEETSKEMERLIQATLAERAKRGVVVPQGSGRFIWPLRGRITSTFGYRRSPFWRRVNFHSGLDIAAPYGSPIVAADGGQVIFSGWWDGYGKAVIIDHGRGYSTVYGHMSRIYVQKDQNVAQGQTIGLVGSTGFSTGPHLHFEVRVNGATHNPLGYLK